MSFTRSSLFRPRRIEESAKDAMTPMKDRRWKRQPKRTALETMLIAALFFARRRNFALSWLLKSISKSFGAVRVLTNVHFDGFLRVFGGEEILRMRERQPGDGAVSLFLIGDPPDGIVSVLANEECAVFRHGKSHGTTPNISLRSNESGQEILVSASRFAAIKRDAHHLVPRSFGPVP